MDKTRRGIFYSLSIPRSFEVKKHVTRYLLLFFFSLMLQPLSAANSYLVYLKDKPAISLGDLKKLFSEKALYKRTIRNIAFNETDFPINRQYLNEVSKYGTDILGLKWINAIKINAEESGAKQLEKLPFVSSVQLLNKPSSAKKARKQKFQQTFEPAAYGSGFNQIAMLNGQFLHDSGYWGTNMDIAVFDNGFFKVDSIRFFATAFKEGRVKSVRNFVQSTNQVFAAGSHGTSVLSCMASDIRDTFLGTSPGANYYLFVTEDNGSETKVEEVNWAKAAEMVDSMGIDIINSSLGYTVFDDPATNYTYLDMNGTTTIVSKAAELASSKGILVVNSAGNEGDDAWRYISAPADARTALAIGAVNGSGNIAGFSSRGPSADGRIKPDVVAKGAGTTVVNVEGKLSFSSGTSFSSPVIAGLAACLWQTNPRATNLEIREAIIKSTDKLKFPNAEYGYGLPNFRRAFDLLKQKDELPLNGFLLFPNPFRDFINISTDFSQYKRFDIEVHDDRGKMVKHSVVDLSNTLLGFVPYSLEELANGIYYIKIFYEGKSNIWRVIKQN
jgi:serine protease AprX